MKSIGLQASNPVEERHGGVEKRGGWKTSRLTPLPRRGFGPPSYGTFSTPLMCQCSAFPVQKSTTEQTRSSFGGVQKFSGERVLWYVFLPRYSGNPKQVVSFVTGSFRQVLATRSSSARQTFVSIVFVFAIARRRSPKFSSNARQAFVKSYPFGTYLFRVSRDTFCTPPYHGSKPQKT